MFALSSVSFGESLIDWLWICAGVLISVILPVLSAYVRSVFKPTAAGVDFKKYGALLLFSALTSLLVLAAFRVAQPDQQILWYAALLAGYGWEATLEKIIVGPRL